MSTINITNARANLYEITNKVIESHEPITVTSKNGNVVLVSEEDFESLMETLHLQTIPGLLEDAKSINNGVEKLSSRDELGW